MDAGFNDRNAATGLRVLAPVPTRHSLRWRLPLLISGLIALVLATFSWIVYRQVEETLMRAAGERAQRAADQIAGLLDAHGSIDRVQRLAAAPELRAFLETRTDAAREQARSRLTPLTRSDMRRVEVWDNAGTKLLESVATGSGTDPREASKQLPPGAPPSILGVGPLQGSDYHVFTDIIAEIPDGRSTAGRMASTARLGYVRVRTTFVESPPGVFSRLVGYDAVVRIANRTGGTWTDLARMLPAAPVDLARPGVAQYSDANGDMRLGAVALIQATPWAAWVDFPMARIIAPAGLFLKETLALALVFVMAAGVLATALAARTTSPLAEINKAAAAFAGGEYSRRVTVKRRDEIGHLGRTFNAMAADVQAAAEDLKKSEDSYRRLFASNPHPMWVYDTETLRFLAVNDMAIVRYGYSREEFLAMTLKDVRPSTELPALLDNVSRPAHPAEQSGLWKHRKKDGTVIDVDVSSHGLVLDGRPARVVLAHDVTARLEAERALRESEELFRGMAETMPHIVWTARPDSRFEYLNRQFFDYTGLRPEDMQRADWHVVLHPEDRAATIERRTHAFRAGEPYEATYRLKRAADGQYRWHVGRAAPLRNDRGDILLWVGTSTDVHDATQAADALKSLNADLEQRVLARTAALEAAKQELESFSYSVSHDLRAPLRHIQGYVEMLTASTAGNLSEKGQRYLKTIVDVTVEMGELIDGLLAFSQIGRVQLSEGRVSLDALVQASIAGLEMATRNRHIVWKIAPLPETVGDPSLLKQVFANLLGNAIKYTRQRDPAEIEIGCAGEEDGRSILFVRDNGAGFEPQYAHKLFGVFQRLHRAEDFEGTGIGLATVRRIITRHGGRTWAAGKVNEGATIYFTLKPVTQPAPVMLKADHEFSQTHPAR